MARMATLLAKCLQLVKSREIDNKWVLVDSGFNNETKREGYENN